MEPAFAWALGLLVLLVVGFVGLAWRSRRRTRQGWEALARALGVAYEAPGEGQPYGRVRGVWEGFVVEVGAGTPGLPKGHPLLMGMEREGRRGGGMYVKVWCEGELGCGLLMTRELPGFLRQLMPLGGADVEVGDKAFDEMFQVMAHDGEEVRRVLTAKARGALRACGEEFKFGFLVTDEGPVAYQTQIEPDTERLRRQVVLLREAAAALSEGKRGG